MKKKKLISKCCNATVNMVPPSKGDPGMFFCSKCLKDCGKEMIYENINIK